MLVALYAIVYVLPGYKQSSREEGVWEVLRVLLGRNFVFGLVR